MKKIVLLLALLFLSAPVFAEDKMDTLTFDVSKYNSTEVDFVKASISAMNIKGWEVDAYEKGKLSANYKKKHTIEVLFNGKEITINQTSEKGGFKMSWLNSLERLIHNGLDMQYYIRQAEQYK